jgi:hypothetical protein
LCVLFPACVYLFAAMSLQRSMLSVRAAAAPIAARLIARPQTIAIIRPTQQLMQRLTAVRSFTTARPVLQAATPASKPEEKAAASSTAVAAAPASSFSEIVQKYGGWYPFIGLAGVIAISKEIIILNEEFLLVTNFATMFTILYLTVGDTITKAAEEQRAELHKKQDDLSDFQIEQYQAALNAHLMNVEQVDVLKRLKTEHNTLSAELLKVKALKLRHSARDAVVKKLGEIKSREASERASFKEIVGARATQYVRRQFAQAPAAVKASLVDFAIDVVEGKRKQLDAKQDPVKRLYADYFGNKLYEQELAQEKQAKA